jgi:hypothetical protein
MSFKESLRRNLRVDEAQIFYTQISEPSAPLISDLIIVLTMHFFSQVLFRVVIMIALWKKEAQRFRGPRRSLSL